MDIALYIVVFVVLIFASGVKILRPVEVGIVEFLGRYSKTASAGFNWIIPYLSKMYRINITERRVDIDPQSIITKDIIIDLNIPTPKIEGQIATKPAAITATKGSTILTSGRDSKIISDSEKNLSLTELERELILLNRRSGNEKMLHSFIKKLQELEKIIDEL